MAGSLLDTGEETRACSALLLLLDRAVGFPGWSRLLLVLELFGLPRACVFPKPYVTFSWLSC